MTVSAAARKSEVDSFVERALALENKQARKRLVEENPSAEWDEVIRTLAERVWQEVRVDTHRAEQLADAAVELAEAWGNPVSLGKSLRSKANALYALDQHAAAIQFHEQAIAQFEQAGENAELARTLSGSIQPLLLLGRYDQALAVGERAKGIFQQQGNTHRLARLEINIANIHHRQDRFSEALAIYEHAYQELLKHDDAEGLAAALSNISLCCISLNDFPKALDVHRKARQHCEKKGMPILVAYADYNIAYLYYLRGEYGRAIQMLRDAAVSAKNAGDAYQQALCNLDLSEIYLELNLSKEAGELGHLANELFEELGFGYEAAKALAFAAIAASRTGQSFEGIKLFARAKEMFVRDKNHVWPALIDLYEALVLFGEGRLIEAKRLCTEAREFFRKSPMHGKAILAELLMARISLRMNDATMAHQHCGHALQDLESVDSPILRYQAEFLMGEIERAAGKQQEAYESYRRARKAVERLRGNLRGEELKIAFFGNKLEVYEHLVDLCLQRAGGMEEAFEYIEQSKSRALVDYLSHSVHIPAENHSGQSELVRSIRNFREELNWYYNLIEREQLQPEERSPERIKALEQQARAREEDLARVLKEATIAEAHQAGMQVAAATISLEHIRAALPAETAIVEYFQIQNRSMACVLTREALQFQPITVNSRIQKLLQLLQFQMSKFRLGEQYVKTFREPLQQAAEGYLKSLYNELVAPLRPFLNARHLVFVPHGLLHYVPFHALHDGKSYLIDEYTVSYAPSASVHAVCQTRKSTPHGGALILGVPDAQAPSIRVEAESVSQIIPGAKLFLGPDATEEVLREHGRNSRIVHIATHGYFRQDNPMFSSIRLGKSHLSLYDMYHLQLPAELVVLSGCATGVNVVNAGDELMGLVRGLFQAGARSLVLSLWDVHDESTKDFMIEFYRRFEQGSTRCEAMRSAMLSLREKYPHPYHWAPFSLIGKE